MKRILFCLVFLFLKLNCFQNDLHNELKAAICSKDADKVKALLKSGAKSSYEFSDGMTAFMIASMNSNDKVVYELLREEPVVSVGDSVQDIIFVKDDSYRNAFWFACANPDPSVLELLLNYSAMCAVKEFTSNLMIQSRKYPGKTTSLMIACIKNHFKHVQLILSTLVKNKIKTKEYINLKDKKGRSTLHFAAENGNLDMVTILLAFGANIQATDFSGQTALHYAAKASKLTGATKANHQAVIGFLIKNKINQEVLDKDGKTALDLYK